MKNIRVMCIYVQFVNLGWGKKICNYHIMKMFIDIKHIMFCFI